MTHATIAEPSTHHDLSCILSTPGIQALFLEESQRQTWLDELSEAVEQGHFVLQRTELTGVDIDTIATWLDRNLPRGCVSEGTRNALVSDILRLTNMIEELTAAHWYALRCFTAAPDHRCGFHVDTVPPGAPAWGVLRVYNGQLTDWVEPSQVRSMAAFYHWLHQRDRVVRENPHASIARDAALGFLDDSPDFLVDNAQIRKVPSGTAVIFRHLNANHLWQDHPTDLAWIHCSPMQGKTRLVVNISPHRCSMTSGHNPA